MPRNLHEILGPPPDDLGAAVPSRVVETVVLRFLARVVHADGVIHPKEVEFLLGVATTMQLGEDEARRILDDELAAKSDPEALARQIVERVHRRSVYALGCMMALAEGAIADAEREVLAAFARGAELGEDEAQEIADEVVRAAAEGAP